MSPVSLARLDEPLVWRILRYDSRFSAMVIRKHGPSTRWIFIQRIDPADTRYECLEEMYERRHKILNFYPFSNVESNTDLCLVLPCQHGEYLLHIYTLVYPDKTTRTVRELALFPKCCSNELFTFYY